MIAILEWTKSKVQQNIEQLQTPTRGVTINKKFKILLQIHIEPRDNNAQERTTTAHSHPAYLTIDQHGCLPGSLLYLVDMSICFIV